MIAAQHYLAWQRQWDAAVLAHSIGRLDMGKARGAGKLDRLAFFYGGCRLFRQHSNNSVHRHGARVNGERGLRSAGVWCFSCEIELIAFGRAEQSPGKD